MGRIPVYSVSGFVRFHCMFNVYTNQQSRQTESRNLMGPKTLPKIWYTYMMLVTKYQISAINSYWEKCDEKYLGQTEGRTDRGKTVYPPSPSGSGGIKTYIWSKSQRSEYDKRIFWPNVKNCLHRYIIKHNRWKNNFLDDFTLTFVA
jgi:hypothetical protein